jgi:hypothetical protein
MKNLFGSWRFGPKDIHTLHVMDEDHTLILDSEGNPVLDTCKHELQEEYPANPDAERIRQSLLSQRQPQS